MVDKISIGIGLEGGDDVRKQLEEIVGGVDGLKSAAEELGQVDATLEVRAEGADEAKTGIDGVKGAAEELGQTEATVEVKVEGADEAKTKIDDLKGEAEELGQIDATVNVSAEGAAEAKGLLDPLSQSATVISGSIDALGLAFSRMGARMTRSLGPIGVFARALGPVGIAVGVLAGTLIKFGDSSADALNKLTVQSAKLGLTAQQLDTLQQAFGRLGVAPDALASSLEKLKPLLGGGLMRVGDIVPPSVFTGLQQFIAQLQRMPDGIDRTKLALATLGDALGGQVIAGLQTGTISAKNFAAALGSVTPATQQQIVEAAKYQQTLNGLNAAWTELKRVITPITTPILEFLTRELTIIRAEVSNLVAQWNVLVAALKLFGSPLEGQAEAAQKVRAAWEELQKNNEQLRQTYQQVGQTAQQAGQQAGQAGQQAGQGVLVWNEALGRAVLSTQQTGQAAQQAGQQAASGFMVWDEKLGAITQQQAALAQSSAQAGAASTQAAQQGTSGWQGLISAIQGAGTELEGFINKMLGIAWDVISSAGVAAWNALTGAIQGAINKLLEFIGLKPSGGAAAPAAAGAAAPAAAGGGQFASGGLLGGRGTGTSDSNLAWLSRGEYIMPARVVAQPGVASFLEALRRGGGIPGFADGGFIRGVTFSGGGGMADKIADWIGSIAGANNETRKALEQIAQSVVGVADSLTDKLFPVVSAMTDALNALNRGGGNARGGLLGGRGTGTSDSNLAWVSRGEHIMPARAVARPGVLAFLEMLRMSGGDLRRVLDGMGRFALGGLVPRAIPAFATGGLAGGMSNVTIQFPGLPEIGGLRASSGAVDELRKAAALAQVRSGGRKPSRYS